MLSNLKNKLLATVTLLRHGLTEDNRGFGTLEMVLIILVILGVLVIFRDNIEDLITNVFGKIDSQVNSF